MCAGICIHTKSLHRCIYLGPVVSLVSCVLSKYVKYVAVKGVELIALSVDVYSRGKNNLIYEKKSSKKNRFSYVWKSI